MQRGPWNTASAMQPWPDQPGIALLPIWLFKAEARAKRLVLLLPDWHPAVSTRIYALYPSRRSLTPKSRAFLSFLQREMPSKLGGG